MLKVAVLQTFLLFFQTLLYFGVQKFEGPTHDISCKIDSKIHFWPYIIFIYILWYPIIAVFPLCLYWYNPYEYAIYILAIIADIILSITFYLIYPTSFDRPEPPGGFIGWVMRIVYRCDYKGKNCMPSMHCSMCFIITYSAIRCMEFNSPKFGGAIILALLIVVSTVLTKQHVIIDVITGLLAAIISVGIALLLSGLYG